MKSLKTQTTKAINKNYPDLKISPCQEWYDRFTSDQSYYWIIMAISGVFGLIILKNCFSWLDWLNLIVLSKETAAQLLENRIGNIATMIGFSLSIATFLVTNTEKKGKENREVLIKKTRLYPTLYLALVILLFYIVVSFCKDAMLLKNDKFSTRLFCDFVLFLHYLILILIIAVISLFKNIIHVFNPSFTDKWLEENVILAVKRGLKKTLLAEVSSQLYEVFINSIDAENLHKDKKMRWGTSGRQFLEIPNNRQIIDINLACLKKTIAKYPNTEIYPSVQALHIFAEPSAYLSKHLFSLSETNEALKKDLLKSFKFGKPVSEMLSFENYQPLLKKRLLEAIKKNNEEDFDTVFSIYNAIFDTYFGITQGFKAHNPKDKIGYDLLYSLKWDIEELLKSAIENDRPEFLANILNLVEHNVYRAFNNRQLIPFVDYLKIYNTIYPLILYKKSCSDRQLRRSFAINRSFMNTAFEDSESIEEKQIINLFFIQYYNAFAQLVYGVVSVYTTDKNLSTEVAERVKRHFEERVEDLRAMSNAHIRGFTPSVSALTETEKTAYLTDLEREKIAFRTQFAIQSWITHLYHCDQIKELDYETFLKDIELPSYRGFSIVNEVMELILQRSKQTDERIELNDWGHIRDETRSFNIMPINTEYWLIFSLVIELLGDYSLIEREFDHILINTRLQDYKDDITKFILEIKTDTTKWEKTLRHNGFDNFEWAEKNILASLTKLERRYESYLNKVRAEQPLSAEKVESFKKEVHQNWAAKKTVMSIFDYFNATKPILEDNEQLEVVGMNPCYRHEFKKIFVEKESINLGTEDIGAQTSKLGNDYFFNAILKGLTPHTFASLDEAIKASINKLRDKDIEPNIIIVGSNLIYRREFDKEPTEFVYNWRLKEEAKSKIGVGIFANIPVIEFSSDSMKNKVIVAHFHRAFELEIFENEEWIDKRLYVNVKDFSHEEAVQHYEQNPSGWKTAPDGEERSFEDVINYIRNIIRVEVYSKLNIQILDKEAFEVTSVEYDKLRSLIKYVE